MPKKVYTISTRLEKESPLVVYASNYITDYNKIYRYAWNLYLKGKLSKVEFKKELQKKYGILARTANTMHNNIEGTIRAYRELKKTELQELEIKIKEKESKIEKILDYLSKKKPYVTENKVSIKALEKYRRYKKSLYYQKNKLNKMKQKRDNLKKQIKKNIVSIGFGSKKMFDKQYRLKENGYKTHEKWYNDYVKARDKNIYYLGCNTETQGNQMFQMKYNKEKDIFELKVRKDYVYAMEDKYVIDIVNFKYQKELLKDICLKYENKEKPNALSYRIHKKGNKWYLQVMFTIEYDDYSTSKENGTLGLDYNEGFIEISETDKKGNLIGQYHYDLKYHGTGNKAKTELEQVICKIVYLAKAKGKDIVIEDLDFKRTKGKQSKAIDEKGKRYNRMLHRFDYRRYKDVLENISHRNKVRLIKVNPKNTSKLGKQKYANSKKLNVHQAASYVIARRGQGYIDKLVS